MDELAFVLGIFDRPNELEEPKKQERSNNHFGPINIQTKRGDNMLQKQIDKYLASKDETRLEIILTSNKLKPTKQNIKALKMLITDYEDDKELMPLNLFLGLKEAIPELDLSVGPMNTDEFDRVVRNIYGDPTDKNSLGNKILDGRQNRFTVQSWYKPDEMLRKFSAMASRQSIELDFYPLNISSGATPIYDVCILGTAKINRLTQVNLS